MTLEFLVSEIRRKKSFLCVGLDVDLDKIPKFLLGLSDPIYEFNKAIIDATHLYTVAYKPNLAFYEANGVKGWIALEKTIRYLNETYPEIFTIADAKRGDIGNTASMYAKAFFEDLGFDSVTVAPYMGRDSVEPFLEFKEKHAILLALTSNEGALDFQTKQLNGEDFYKEVIHVSQTWKNSENLMYVVGATRPDNFKAIRKIIPNAFLLVPGVGAQGGSLHEVCRYGLTSNVGLLVNSSRGIIYASYGADYAEAAGVEARRVQKEMSVILNDCPM